MSDAGAGMIMNSDGIVGLLLRLRDRGVEDRTFMKVVEAVPHDRFVPVEYTHCAWLNESLPLPCGQTMYAPDTAVRLVHALGVAHGHAVLEIGTGSGYQTALLARLARKVKSLDRYKTLIDAAQKRLAALGFNNVMFQHMDGRDGTMDEGLYDRIVIDSVCPEMPRDLLGQLVAGGVVVTAIGEPKGAQMAVKLTKIGNRFEREDLFPVHFTPLESGVARAL